MAKGHLSGVFCFWPLFKKIGQKIGYGNTCDAPNGQSRTGAVPLAGLRVRQCSAWADDELLKKYSVLALFYENSLKTGKR